MDEKRGGGSASRSGSFSGSESGSYTGSGASLDEGEHKSMAPPSSADGSKSSGKKLPEPHWVSAFFDDEEDDDVEYDLTKQFENYEGDHTAVPPAGGSNTKADADPEKVL